MSGSKQLHLFEGIGIELEYMIVDRQTLAIRPVADEVLRMVTGRYQSDYEQEDICWSNELALHVVELKTCGPVQDLAETLDRFRRDIARINTLLERSGAMLMPTGAHPWMDPFCETRLWPHEQNVIYEAYHRIFDCRGHGWSNLQSVHLNLPFADDEEFGRLHAAIRVLLPLLPALAASTPIVDLQIKESLDYRLEVYKSNSQRIPSVTGRVVPEPVFTRDEYERRIFVPMYRDIAPFDQEGILRYEWLNARGAIARFDRSTIEIRIIDVQECPLADLAVASLVFATLKALVAGKWSTLAEQQRWEAEPLAALLDRTIRRAEKTPIEELAYAALFSMEAEKGLTAGKLWQRIFEALKEEGTINPTFFPALDIILTRGSLASRIIGRLGAELTKPAVAEVYNELCSCLAEGRMFAF
ncbi:MAG: glutamate-cysteine ligase family protein [Deltaproteobacteria bacterium]|jgi:carboxylate-amine ligase